MPEWAIAIISALAVLLLKEIYEWLKRPRIMVIFERWTNGKLRVIDISFGEQEMGIEQKSRRVRLNVQNNGRKPALSCEAKALIVSEEDGDSAVQPLHWARRDPRIYQTLDQMFAPIDINTHDNEFLEVLELDYEMEIEEQKLKELSNNACIKTISPYSVILEKGKIYRLEITVYANNAISKPFKFRVDWDGTLEGFEKAFTKV